MLRHSLDDAATQAEIVKEIIEGNYTEIHSFNLVRGEVVDLGGEMHLLSSVGISPPDGISDFSFEDEGEVDLSSRSYQYPDGSVLLFSPAGKGFTLEAPKIN
jgi:hypothetical protein